VTNHKPTKIALTEITTLEQALDDAPARKPTEVSKGEAIAILAPKLNALRTKGYTWREVAAWLTEHGVAVTAPALQRHLRAPHPAAADRHRGRSVGRGRRGSIDRATAFRDAPVGTAAKPAPSPPVPKDAPSPQATPEAAARASGPTAVRPAFAPRRDPEGT
jgi:hypothetical protein